MPLTHTKWSDEQESLLRDLYPTASWDELREALPTKTRTAIYARARGLGLSRWNQGSKPTGKVALGTATEAEIGWLAGMLDGEGTLQLSMVHREDRSYLRPMLRITGNHRQSIERACSLMGGFVHQTRPGHWATTLFGTHHIERVLEVLLPHLTVKAERARLLVEYARVRKAAPGRAPYGETEEELYQRFYEGSGRASASRSPRKLNSYANPELTPTSSQEDGDHV